MESNTGSIIVRSVQATIAQPNLGDAMVKPKNVKRKKKPFKRGVPHKNKADKRAKENKHPDYTKEE